MGAALFKKSECGQLLYGIKVNEVVPEIGSNVFKSGKVVGTITSGTYSPTLDCGIGFVRFYFHGNWKAEKVQILTTTDEFHDAKIVDLPFFDSKKEIPKGFG